MLARQWGDPGARENIQFQFSALFNILAHSSKGNYARLVSGNYVKTEIVVSKRNTKTHGFFSEYLAQGFLTQHIIFRGGYGRLLGKLSERGWQAAWPRMSKERATTILEQAAAAEEIEAAKETLVQTCRRVQLTRAFQRFKTKRLVYVSSLWIERK